MLNQRKGTILRYLSRPRGKKFGFFNITVLGQAMNIHIKYSIKGGKKKLAWITRTILQMNSKHMYSQDYSQFCDFWKFFASFENY